MNKKKQILEFGNFICKFGDNLNLMDLFEEVVRPAFIKQDPPYLRKYDTTTYFLYGTKLVRLRDPSVGYCYGIAGRFVKDMLLEREQVFDVKQGLVRNEQTMPSSPSAFFLLVLHNHRLLYVKEVVGAPSIEQFGASLQSILSQRHREYLAEEYVRRNAGEKKVTKAAIQHELPYPRVQVIPLTSAESTQEFLGRFSKLTKLEIRFSDRNTEFDIEPFFAEFQERKDKTGASSSSIIHTNTGDGLNINGSKSEIAEAAQQGNQVVKLKGVDKHGAVLQGDNNDFKLKQPLATRIGKNVVNAAETLYSKFLTAVASGSIVLPPVPDKVKNILSNLPDEDD